MLGTFALAMLIVAALAAPGGLAGFALRCTGAREQALEHSGLLAAVLPAVFAAGFVGLLGQRLVEAMGSLLPPASSTVA